MNFENHLKLEVLHIRDRLALENIGWMRFDIEVRGRTEAGELAIEFRVGTEYGDGQAVGGDLDAVVEEFLRRHAWKKRNAPLCLPSAEVPEEDEIPS